MRQGTGASQDYDSYTDENLWTWRRLVEIQVPRLRAYACDEFLEGYTLLEPYIQDLPRLEVLSQVLEHRAGWHLTAADGFLSAEDYFGLLAERMFPVVPEIRLADNLNFTPAPDIWHDVCGHLPLLFDCRYAHFVQALGQVFVQSGATARKAASHIYWYTVEMGTVSSPGGRKVYGSGILSGPEEILKASEPGARVQPFDLTLALDTEPCYEELQSLYLAIESFDEFELILEALEELLADEELPVARESRRVTQATG